MKVLRGNSEGLSSLSNPMREGKGLMVQIAEKLQLRFTLQKTLIFPWPFCLDVLNSL